MLLLCVLAKMRLREKQRRSLACPKAKSIGCIIPAKTAATATLLLATAASVMQPGSSIEHLEPDACLHADVGDFDKLGTIYNSVHSSANDEWSLFRDAQMPQLIV